MKLKCPYCDSHRIQTVGGDNGDPFDRRPEKTVCLDCGRTINSNIDIADLLKKVNESDKMKDGD